MPTLGDVRASFLAALGTIVLLGGCHRGAVQDLAKTADRVFVGGSIVTLTEAAPVVEAVAIKDGKIVAVGNRGAVMTWRGEKTTVTDLAGKALLPGFFDAHGHLAQRSGSGQSRVNARKKQT